MGAAVSQLHMGCRCLKLTLSLWGPFWNSSRHPTFTIPVIPPKAPPSALDSSRHFFSLWPLGVSSLSPAEVGLLTSVALLHVARGAPSTRAALCPQQVHGEHGCSLPQRTVDVQTAHRLCSATKAGPACLSSSDFPRWASDSRPPCP